MRMWALLAVLAIGALVLRQRSHGSSSFEAELKNAKKSGQPLVLDFSMTGCAPCRAFESAILSKPVVQDAIKQVRFVRYNVSEDSNAREAADRLDVHAFPTILIVGNDGRERIRQAGFNPGPAGAAQFAAFLRSAGAPSVSADARP